MNTDIPSIGKKYKVISGHYTGFVGECVSYDLEHDIPVILQDKKTWDSCAVRLNEIETIETDYSGLFPKTDISRLQNN